MNCLIEDGEGNLKFSSCIVFNEEYNYVIVIRSILGNIEAIAKQGD
jgi:hypothetical protein